MTKRSSYRPTSSTLTQTDEEICDTDEDHTTTIYQRQRLSTPGFAMTLAEPLTPIESAGSKYSTLKPHQNAVKGFGYYTAYTVLLAGNNYVQLFLFKETVGVSTF
jgi:hypothetical protein